MEGSDNSLPRTSKINLNLLKHNVLKVRIVASQRRHVKLLAVTTQNEGVFYLGYVNKKPKVFA